MEVTSIRTEGLDDSTYILSHEGVGLVVDPQRDINRFEQVLSDYGVDLRFGTVEGSVLAYVPDIAAATPENPHPSREVWVGCETGYRANIAASILQTRGFDPVVLTGAGIAEVVAALGNG